MLQALGNSEENLNWESTMADDIHFEFLSGEFWILSWNASVQRALRYTKGTNGQQRANFRRNVVRYCEENILPFYKKKVTETEHKNNIKKICHYVEELNENDFIVQFYNIGVAQKLLNLQLKYLWAAGYIQRPPHCPVDRIILSKTKLKGKFNWTQIETIEAYEKAIAAISEVAGNVHISDWELCSFNRR